MASAIATASFLLPSFIMMLAWRAAHYLQYVIHCRAVPARTRMLIASEAVVPQVRSQAALQRDATSLV